MKWSFERKLLGAGFSLALLLTGVANFFSHHHAIESLENATQVQNTQTVIDRISELYTLLLDAESGRRGYILSGSNQELARYHRAIQKIPSLLIQLRQQARHRPDLAPQLDRLEYAIEQRLSIAQQSLQLYQQNPAAKAKQSRLFITAQKLRLEIQQTIHSVQNIERQQQEQWARQTKLNLAHQQWLDLLTTILSWIIIAGTFVLLYRQSLQRQRSEVHQQMLLQGKELSELKLRFFSLVSHEFRTPLSVILGSAHLLLNASQSWTEDKRVKNLHRIQSSARLMTQLLTDILTLTRAESGKLIFAPEWIELESFCLNILADLEMLEHTDRAIEFVSHGGYTQACLDEKLLYSILSNILTNAIKYSPLGKSILFSLDCRSPTIFFKIRDRGIGIPPESLSALYEPFYRAENVGNVAGTGLGLAVVKQCLELHRGEIAIESEVGVGTTFTIAIPRDLYNTNPQS